MEEWRTIPGHERYQASSRGRIRSTNPRTRTGSGGVLKVRIVYGYQRVNIVVKEKRFNASVARLVCAAFNGEPNKEQICRHMDGRKLNNTPRNLAWGTPLDNAADCRRHRRWTRGSRQGHAKLTESQVLRIRKIYADAKGERKQCPRGIADLLAKKYGVAKMTIHMVVGRFNWRHI